MSATTTTPHRRGWCPRAALLVLGTSLLSGAPANGALAATPAYGSGCSYTGNTIAEGGTVGSVVSNAMSYSGASCGGSSVDSHGTVYGSEWTGDYYFDYSFAQGALAGSTASGGLGVLHAYAHSATDSTPKEYWYTDNNGGSHAIANEYLAYSKSYATSYWFDQLQVQQGSAPYGRVILRFTLQLGGSESVTPSSAGRAEIGARFIVDDDRNVSDRTISLDAPGSFSFTAGYYPGTSISLFGDLSATTEIRAGGKVQNAWGWWVPGSYIPTAEAFANAANTAGFQVEVLTEGAGYTTASGRSYIAMVPEPSSYAMLGLGMGVVLLAAQRRRRG